MLLHIIFITIIIEILLFTEIINGNTVIIIKTPRSNGEIKVVTNETRYQILHPNASLQLMTQSEGPKNQIKYEFGKRITGDKFLKEIRDGTNFPQPKDVEILLRYPEKGEAEKITYIYVLVDQGSSTGQGYIVSGGLDQRFVEVLIQANNSINFAYVASFYGY